MLVKYWLKKLCSNNCWGKETCNLTGYEVATQMLSASGINNVDVLEKRCSANFDSTYDPENNIVWLPVVVFNSSSVLAICSSCHEVGHAIQYAIKNRMLLFRNSVSRITDFFWIVLLIFCTIGIFSNVVKGENAAMEAFIGLIIYFVLVVVCNLLDLVIELQSSNLAVQFLRENRISNSENIGQYRRFLAVAALSYVESLVISVIGSTIVCVAFYIWVVA